jgi:hypothetical protein
MHPQLQAVIDDFDAAQRRLHALAASAPAEMWAQRPDPRRWSAAECVAHLNLTSAGYLPLLDEAIERGRRSPVASTPRFRRDPVGWLLWKSMAPPVRVRVKTTAPFIPAQPASPADLAAEFDRLQREQVLRVRQADGLALDRIRVASPFNRRVTYNLYACFTILPRHQHRHLWQAEEALRAAA